VTETNTVQAGKGKKTAASNEILVAKDYREF
jgi:hypothetical protein